MKGKTNLKHILNGIMCTPFRICFGLSFLWQFHHGAHHDINKQVHPSGNYNIGKPMDYVNFILELTI